MLPYIPFPGGHILNLFWDIVCGFGLWMIDETVGLSLNSRLLVIGALVWPIAVSVAMFLLGWKLQKISPRMRLVLICALIASSLCIVSYERAMRPPMLYWPTYHRQLDGVW
jgi:CHASE2 domain-containing sensor protein